MPLHFWVIKLDFDETVLQKNLGFNQPHCSQNRSDGVNSDSKLAAALNGVKWLFNITFSWKIKMSVRALLCYIPYCCFVHGC